ncbi:flagellar basal body P-ring formation chaperone FlgA [bacterium]|jgi:flagella basal body P-ring formation protein FlgA|nr:flagellar basal body P-ring formation chaperone FlgA [bacterium]
MTLVLVALFVSASATAAGQPQNGAKQRVSQLISQEIQKKYPAAKIEMGAISEFPAGNPIHVSLVEDSGRGYVKCMVQLEQGEDEVIERLVSASFTALMPAYIAKKRVLPGEKLDAENFKKDFVNVAHGMAREYRGVILSSEVKLENLQATQTILEGNYPLSSGVQKIPDVKRGDLVRVRVLSGRVMLSLQGTAQEPGNVKDQVRILTEKTKRELKGKVMPDGSIEVQL